jgi:NADH dehydrogenase FAD-containing subunit
MGKHLVMVGAGHAHLTTITAIPAFLDRGHRVTVIGPAPYHYYSGMAPGMLAGTYSPQQIRFNVLKMCTDRGARFLVDRVIKIDPGDRQLHLESGGRVSYDVLSLNVGSFIPTAHIETSNGGIYSVKPIDRILEGRIAIIHSLEKTPAGKDLNLFVVGGGPAGVEMAGGLWRLVRESGNRATITVAAGTRFLDGMPDRVRRLALNSLTARGITVLEGVHTLSIKGGAASLDNGTEIPVDFTFLCTGVKPSTLFTDSGLPTGEDGGLLVNHFLQSVRCPEVLGGGDCITLEEQPLARVGVYAVRQNPVLLTNIAAALEDKPMRRFDPGTPDFLLILNMGDGNGIVRKGRWVWHGKLAFYLKDFIDRRFMRKYQLSGELEEEV